MAGRMPAISLVRDQSAETIRLFDVLPDEISTIEARQARSHSELDRCAHSRVPCSRLECRHANEDDRSGLARAGNG
jgi:hypothetical protein